VLYKNNLFTSLQCIKNGRIPSMECFLNNKENDNWEIALPRREHLKINNFFENIVLFYYTSI